MGPSAEERAHEYAEVLSIVSHDIRAPLGVILAAVSELNDPRVGTLSDEQRALVQLVRRSGERLTRLAANVSFVRRASAGPLVLSRQPTDLRDVARRAIDSFERSGEIGKKLRVALEIPAVRVGVDADAELLVQAATNVLANAIRAARSEITVTVAAADGAPTLAIGDDGPGIPASVRPRLFARGAARSADAKPESERDVRGLGLVVAKGIADAHGATLTVASGVDLSPRPLGTQVKFVFRGEDFGAQL